MQLSMLIPLLIMVRVVLDIFYFSNKKPGKNLHLAYFFLYSIAAILILLIDGLDVWVILASVSSAFSMMQFLWMLNNKDHGKNSHS